jgi:ATP-dependent Clp protease ATP-binding subunit ClpA
LLISRWIRHLWEAILDRQLDNLERHIQNRLEERAFDSEITCEAHAWLLREGTSVEYGTRELKRTILRNLTQPLAAMVENGRIAPDAE